LGKENCKESVKNGREIGECAEIGKENGEFVQHGRENDIEIGECAEIGKENGEFVEIGSENDIKNGEYVENGRNNKENGNTVCERDSKSGIQLPKIVKKWLRNKRRTENATIETEPSSDKGQTITKSGLIQTVEDADSVDAIKSAVEDCDLTRDKKRYKMQKQTTAKRKSLTNVEEPFTYTFELDKPPMFQSTAQLQNNGVLIHLETERQSSLNWVSSINPESVVHKSGKVSVHTQVPSEN
jgi:hypothetical protein